MVIHPHLTERFKKYSSTHKRLFLGSVMLFFWVLFDGIVSYITPLLIVEQGISESTMGLIIGSSSLFGAGFDILLSTFLRNTHYRRLFLLLFVFSGIYPLLLGNATTIPLFILCMAIWGLYYDLLVFGTFDFISKVSLSSEHASNFGVVDVFKSLGYLLAPIFAGLLIADAVGWSPLVLAWIFLGAAFILFLFLSRKDNQEHEVHKRKSLLVHAGQLVVVSRIGKQLLPVLLLSGMLYTFDAFFWTVGPLYSEKLAHLHPLGGLFIAAYTLPTLFIGWVVGFVTKRFGKKRTGLVGLFIGSLVICLLYFISQPLGILGIVLIASTCLSISFPAVQGAYVDYISETPEYEKEIEGLADFFGNVGYVVGPILGGFSAQLFGYQGTFASLGLFGIIGALFLLLLTPKKIKLYPLHYN